MNTGSAPDDYYGFDGKSYGLMNYTGGTDGIAMMADESANSLSMVTLLVRTEIGTPPDTTTRRDTLFVAEDSNITEWTFHLEEGSSYRLSADVNGVTKYLAIGDSLTLTDEENASVITVTPYDGKVRLTSGGKCVCFDGSAFTVSDAAAVMDNQWLCLTELSGLSREDFVTYSAEKISVSDAPDGSSVIVYTRVWNNDRKTYEFYAVDCDGTLYPCYERGDNIMWVGNQINTLLWNFIEYHYDDGSPNFYYELYNPYSRKFIAPQIKNGQILADKKIGINLPGRRDHEYYSTILAWDNDYYAFFGDEVNQYLAKYFAGEEKIFKDYSAHTMTVFYMERGAGASNLHMRFNLSYITPGHVVLTKKVSGTDDIDFDLVEYPYQIWYKDEAEGQEHLLQNNDENISVTYQNSTERVSYVKTYTPPNSTKSYSSVYLLNPCRSAEIHFPANTIEYKVIECGVNTEVYDVVSVNGTQVTGESIGNSNRNLFDSGWLQVSERPTIVFDNHVQSDSLRTLSVQKRLYDPSGAVISSQQDRTTFSYRLYLSNGSDDVLRLANMYKYYVRDPEGNLCSWDAENKCFASTGESDLNNIPSNRRSSITFETSMNGAISMIPAWYTVCVPILPVGTRFSVVERNNEIPLGYKLLGYEREGGTYIVDSGTDENTGWVRANESPRMYVSNQRGWELEVRKIWSDESYVKSHAPIYTAVYISGELLKGSVRQIESPNTSVRYFFDGLKSGKSIDDYVIREVELESPVVGNDGTVTSYGSITQLSSGSRVTVSSVSKESDTPVEHSYIVTYGTGAAEQTAEDILGAGNARSDSITNTRSDGVVITLYDMKTKKPLAGGKFTLERGDYSIGVFTSDSHGRITVMYDVIRGEDYTLTQTDTHD